MGAPERIGRYEIVAEIGRGAMGSVFKARDPMVGRIVALKTIHSAALAGDQSLEYRARFQREARASGVLAHPGIVPVFDVGEDEGAPFLVMEFVDGRTLADAMKKSERFSLDRVCDIGQQIAEALGYAHRQGVIHRDIKPANVLLTSREIYGSERPRITDFGIAKLAASEITTHGQLLGTPSFMPPEQFTGTPVDGRADLFSLGVILYSLATGEQPFAGETMTAVSYKVVYTEPIPPSKLNPAISPRLQAAILKCLAKNPAERFQTGEELAQELQTNRFNLGAPINAAAPPPSLDADATLGPAQSGVTAASLPPAVFSASQSGTAPIPNTAQTHPVSGTGSGAGSGTGTGKKRKPVPVETIFAVILLGIAGMGIVIAGGWFTFQHLLNLAFHKHPQVSVTAPQPVQPVVTIPQVNTTPPAGQTQTNGAQTNGAQSNGTQTNPAQTNGTQTNATQTATSPAGAPPANSPNSPSGSAGKTPQPAPAKTTAAKPAAKPSAGKSKSSTQTAPPPAANQSAANTGAAPTPPASSPAPSSPVAVPAPAAAGASPSAAFNPRKLDPNASTKLKIELTQLPSGLPVNVNMNRKPYLSFVTGDKTDLENLYVPAGVQEFRVVIKSGGQEFDSKGISQDFKAKKKRTLRIELMENGNSLPNATVPLPKDAQVFASFPFILGDVL